MLLTQTYTNSNLQAFHTVSWGRDPNSPLLKASAQKEVPSTPRRSTQIMQVNTMYRCQRVYAAPQSLAGIVALLTEHLS